MFYLDKSLAKGLAKQYLKSKRGYDEFISWSESNNKEIILQYFKRITSNSSKPIVIKKIQPLISSAFDNLNFLSWNKQVKTLFATGLCTANDSKIFRNAETFTENSLFLNNFVVTKNKGSISHIIISDSNISQHTIQRMLQRGLINEDNLDVAIIDILQSARALKIYFESGSIDIDEEKEYSILIPYKDGAFVVVYKKVCADIKRITKYNRVLSVRTYLDFPKLNKIDKDRLENFHLSKDEIIDSADFMKTIEWIKGSIREYK